MVYLHLQSLAAHLYIFLNCLLPKMKTLRCFEMSETAGQMADFLIAEPTGYVMHQHLYALSTLYLCVLYLSENKQRLVPLTA